MKDMREEEQLLKQVGLKSTQPRLTILNWFMAHPMQHVSAENLVEQLTQIGEEVPLATVYRVLNQFEAAHLIEKHAFEGERAVYEYHTGKHHDHLICTICGGVEEFVDPIIEQRQAMVAKKYGYELTHHVLMMYGRCQTCQSTTDSAAFTSN